jgi:hypothetical protein
MRSSSSGKSANAVEDVSEAEVAMTDR